MNTTIKNSVPSSRQAGQGLVEYALIISLIALTVIVIVSRIGSSVSSAMGQFSATVSETENPTSPTQEDPISPSQLAISDISARLSSFFNTNGYWPRTWSPYNFTDIGLNSNDYAQPIDGLYISPQGSMVKIANKTGDNIEVYAQDLNGDTVHLYNGWSIWCPVNDANCYYHTVAPGNEVVPSSIYAVQN